MDCGIDDDKMVGSMMESDQLQNGNEILEILTAPVKSSSGDKINEKMKTDTLARPRRQSMPMEVSRKLFHDDSSKFTKSERIGPHCAVLYYKHKDTDSEQDAGNISDRCGKKNVDDSSEEEWMYTNGNNSADQDMLNNGSSSESRSAALTVESFKPKINSLKKRESDKSRTTSKEDIQRLINEVDDLVREEASVGTSPRKIGSRLLPDKLSFSESKTKKKLSRVKVKDWLIAHDSEDKAINDSCDGSCECTTEDDDLERHSSDDLNTSSIATYHQSAEKIESGDLDSTVVPENTQPLSLLPNLPENPKIILRQKRRDGPQIRPWSTSELSQDGFLAASRLHNFFISESALNQLVHHSTPSKMDSSVHGTLSSSTVEESTIQALEGSGGGYSSNSLRRRKVKLRKRNLVRKSESGSDGLLAAEPSSPSKSIPVHQPVSGTETEEETEEGIKGRMVRKKLLSYPAFRLGPGLGDVTVFKTEKAVSADSSFSEQAWDNYQEKYMSEAYSEEAADPGRLLDFGDDYRNVLDSQSDCASSFSRPLYRRRLPTTGDSSMIDSDSDMEDVSKLLNQSHSQYVFLEQVFTRQLSKASPQLILASDFADIIGRCRKNTHCLRVLLENVSKANDNLLSPQDFQEIRLLIDRWETLEGRAESLHRMRTLQREMTAFHDDLVAFSNRVTALRDQDLGDQDQLERILQQIKVEVAGLRDRKTHLSQLNFAVHRFINDSGHPASSSLKDDVTELYRIWEETHKRASQQLDNLQQLSTAWQQFELHFNDLQVALRGDHDTLRMLDTALQGGTVSPDVATSVRDVAKVLSEKQESMQCESALIDTTTLLLTTQGVCTTEGSGSLSDSGISDSGSEQELSEREKRLAMLRKLARHLEAILAPGSQAIIDMAKRIEQTELELKGLQQTCRDLIVRTAGCVEAKVALKLMPEDVPHSTVPSLTRQHNHSSRTTKNNSSKDFLGLGPDSDDPDPGKRHTWLWRVMRAALPFQMAIMALFCVACLLEPSCCDSINNFNFSLSPQLRYMDGPPPV